MNSWGGIPISVFVETTSMRDPITVRAHNGYREAARVHGHEPPYHNVVDNPHKDGPGLLENNYPGGGKEQLLFGGSVVQVVTESECDAACASLRQQAASAAGRRGQPRVYWDTENAMRPGGASGTARADLVQILAGADACYLFRVCLWPTCFASFAQLLGDPRVAKIAHFAGADVSRLQARFSTLEIRTSENLLDSAGAVSLPSKALDALVAHCLGKWLDKRVDHLFWNIPELLPEHVAYAATDPYAVMLLHRHFLLQPRAHGDRGPSHEGACTGAPGTAREGDIGTGNAGPGSSRDIAEPRVAVSRHRRSSRVINDLVEGAVVNDPIAPLQANSGAEQAPAVSDDEGDDDDEAERDANLQKASALNQRLFDSAKQQVDAYVSSTTDCDLVLTSALSSEQRKQLHRHCDQYDINHRSVGPPSDRHLVVSRWTPLAPITAALALDVVGSLVAKDTAANPPSCTRGRVQAYDGSAASRSLVYDDGSHESVDLATLNMRLSRRAAGDSRAGSRQLPVPTVGTDEASKAELEQLLQGVSDDWATGPRSKLKYDHRHWMGNWVSMVGAQKGSPAYNLFMIMTSDALFVKLKGEYDDVVRHLKKLKMSDDQIKRLRRSYWRHKCRVQCPDPRTLIRRLYDVYLFSKTSKIHSSLRMDSSFRMPTPLLSRSLHMSRKGTCRTRPRWQCTVRLGLIPEQVESFTVRCAIPHHLRLLSCTIRDLSTRPKRQPGRGRHTSGLCFGSLYGPSTLRSRQVV